jgi:hypothetical protein
VSTSDKDPTLSVIREEDEGFDVVTEGSNVVTGDSVGSNVVTGDSEGVLVVCTGAVVGELVLPGKGASVGGGLDGDSVGASVTSVSVGFSVGCSVTGATEGGSVVLVGLEEGGGVPTGDGAGPPPWHSELVQSPKMAKPTVKVSPPE